MLSSFVLEALHFPMASNLANGIVGRDAPDDYISGANRRHDGRSSRKEISMENFAPVSAALGGALIGLASGLLWLANGRIAGVSGILGGISSARDGDLLWRLAFLVGLPIGGVAGLTLAPPVLPDMSSSFPVVSFDPLMLAFAGLLVGVGTRLGGGCTSGHGVCGIARGSERSLVATGTFLIVGAGAVLVMRHLT